MPWGVVLAAALAAASAVALVWPRRIACELVGHGPQWALRVTVDGPFGGWTASWPVGLPTLPAADAGSGGQGPGGAPAERVAMGFAVWRSYRTLVGALRARSDTVATWADARMGFPDAALTAWSVGGAWAALAAWHVALDGRAVPRTPYRVVPAWAQAGLEAQVGGIFHVTGVDIIHAIWLAARAGGGQRG